MGSGIGGRENCFQQSERSAGHFGEGLHQHSMGLQVCPNYNQAGMAKYTKQTDHYISVLYSA